MMPRLEPIKAGWAARGDGWAVHGSTKEEAERKFEEAQRRHEEMSKRTDSPNSPLRADWRSADKRA